MTENITMGLAETMTIGCDLGDQYSYVCVLDTEGQIVEETRVKTTQKDFEKYFGAQAAARVVIEVCGLSRWVDAFLRGLGHDVVVANPRKVRLISQSNCKNDRKDAQTLARLGRVDPLLLSPIKHRGAAAQRVLCSMRARDGLVRSRTQLVNSARGMLKAWGTRLPSCSSSAFAKTVKDLVPTELKAAIDPLLEVVATLTATIGHYDKQLAEMAKVEFKDAQLLMQVTGVGPLTALAFIATVEDPSRFKRSRDVGAYFGLVPRQDQSGKTDKQLGITKAGNPFVRKLLVQCSHYILGHFGPDTDLRRWGLSLAERGGKNAKKRAVVAVARRLSVLLHRLWVTGEIYEPLGYGRPVSEVSEAA